MKSDDFQKLEALRFISENKSSVDNTYMRIKTSCKRFVDEYGLRYYEIDTLAKLNLALANNDISKFFLIFRSNVIAYDNLGIRSKFWDIVDAMSAFFDSIGSYWPYVTHENRIVYLQHSNDYLNALDNAFAI